jgi:simple sugar transport system permease protein
MSDITLYFIILVLVFAVLSAVMPSKFLRLTNIQSMLFQIPEFGILALGMMVTILTGGIDLSIISTANLAGVAAALVLTNLGGTEATGWSMFSVIALAIITAVATGTVCGLFNGTLVAIVGLSPILATLGTMKLYEGISLVITKGAAILQFPEPFLFIGSGTLSIVPVPIIIFAGCAVAMFIFLNKTRLGFSIYMVGENPTASRFSGLNNRMILIKTYMISGLLAGVATVIMISRVNSIKVGYGFSYLLQAVLVAILGGVSPTGGKGTVRGVVLGIFILQFISSGFNIIGFSNFFRNVIWGGMLILVTVMNIIITMSIESRRQKLSSVQAHTP